MKFGHLTFFYLFKNNGSNLKVNCLTFIKENVSKERMYKLFWKKMNSCKIFCGKKFALKSQVTTVLPMDHF